MSSPRPDPAADPKQPTTWWRYRHMLFRYKGRLFWGILTLVVTNGLGVYIPWLVRAVIDALETAKITVASADLYGTLLTILGVSLVMLLTRIISRQFLLGIGRLLEYDLRNALYGKMLTLPPSYFSAHPTGDLMSRMTNDVTAIRFMTGGGIMLTFNTALAYLASFPMMMAISPRLTVYALLIFPLGILLMRKISTQVKNHYFAVQEILGDLTTLTQENLSGMRVIQSYAKEPVESGRFLAQCTDYLNAFIRLVDVRVWLFLVMVMVSGASMLVVLWQGGSEVLAQQMDLGGYVAFTLYLERLAWPTMALGWALSTFQQGAASLDRIDAVLSATSTIKDPAQETSAPKQALTEPLSLSIRDLSFQFLNPYRKASGETEPPATATTRFALKNITLEFPPGSTVAFVGTVGAGKTTLLSLLPRLLEVPRGTLFISGQDILDIPLEVLRSHIAFMPQSSFLFSTSVADNIAYGKPKSPQETIQSYAELTQIHPEILNFHAQYDTLVGERGVILSGGQRQRIALARTLLVEPDILILDDPFSHLDSVSEKNIIDAIEARNAFGDKITLFSTHRFALVQHADWVVLMDQGQVIATGTHQALLETQPLYQRLNRLDELREALGEGVDPELLNPEGERG